jgi:hypothetical protein
VRVRSAAALLLTAGLLAGCSAGGDDGASATAGTPSSTGSSAAAATGDPFSAPLTEEQVRAAVLQVSDLPTGWSAAPYEPEDDSADIVFTPTSCNDRFYALVDDGDEPAIHEDGATFSRGGDAGTALTAEVGTYDSTLEEDSIDEMRSFLRDCGSMSAVLEDMKFDATLGETSFPELGTNRFALRVTLEHDSGIAISADIVTIAQGTTGVFINATGFTPIEPAELVKISESALKRLDDAVAGRVTAPPKRSETAPSDVASA